MKKFWQIILRFFLKIALWFRYSIEYKGLDQISAEKMEKSGGILFLPNHPTGFLDPVVMSAILYPRFPVRPLVTEAFYGSAFIVWILSKVDALAVPDFDFTSNSLKLKKTEVLINTVIKGIKDKEQFLIYPAGRTKSSSIEKLGGASLIHRIISDAPEVNVVLVRIKGLWGSSFSRIFTGKTPPLAPTLWAGIKHVFKNLLFFTPRRKISIEFEIAPADFPYKSTRLELNRYLENWYNQPDGLNLKDKQAPGDTEIFIPYSIWDKKVPKPQKDSLEKLNGYNLAEIPEDIKNNVIKEISRIMECPLEDIKPEMLLASDLGMDSLNIAELSVFLQHEYDIENISVKELSTVGRVMAIAAKKVIIQSEYVEKNISLTKWQKPSEKNRVFIPAGDTIPEVFLTTCKKMKRALACADERSGILTYSDLQMRTLILAEYIRNLPGEYIGILLPSTVAAYIVILATQLAGKIPLMINWTVGPRHLDSVIKLSNVQVVLSSWVFLDRLHNVDLNGIDRLFLMLEDVRKKITFSDKLKALWRSKKSVHSILHTFGIDKQSKEKPAVLLFTSGTENLPKGVPLSHSNILSNQRDAATAVEIYSNDVFLGVLPPFHSFGFTFAGLFSLLVGIKIAYFPDPTDSKGLVRMCEKWKITLFCAAPTFLKGMFKMAKPEQLNSLRLCVTGAEKAPAELFQMAAALSKKAELLEGYGITECSPVLTINRVGEPRIGVGQPLPSIELLIVNPETFIPLPLGEQGMILARGPNIFSCYINPDVDPPFTMVEGKKWYKTGDLGYLDKENNLTISGRLKRFIKMGPEMVSLSSIEDALQQSAIKKGWITEIIEGPSLAICAREIEGEKPRVYLFSRFLITTEEANRALREFGFSNLVKVSSVMQVQEIPLAGTGKVNYRSLEGQYLPK